MRCKLILLLLLLERVEERRIKSRIISLPSLKGKEADACVDTHALILISAKR